MVDDFNNFIYKFIFINWQWIVGLSEQCEKWQYHLTMVNLTYFCVLQCQENTHTYDVCFPTHKTNLEVDSIFVFLSIYYETSGDTGTRQIN